MTAQLFDAPARRLLVPVGCGAYWGVDSSVRAVSVGWALPGPENRLQRGVVTVPWARGEGAARLACAYEALTERLRSEQDAGRLPVPGLVWVEQPSGDKPNLQLVYMVGVIQAALAAVAPRARVETIPGPSWKKAACGYGGISKIDRETRKPHRDPFGYQVLRVARDEWGYHGTSWDEADSLGIAEAARRTVALEPR